MQRVQDLHKMSQLLREIIILLLHKTICVPSLKGKKAIPLLCYSCGICSHTKFKAEVTTFLGTLEDLRFVRIESS